MNLGRTARHFGQKLLHKTRRLEEMYQESICVGVIRNLIAQIKRHAYEQALAVYILNKESFFGLGEGKLLTLPDSGVRLRAHSRDAT